VGASLAALLVACDASTPPVATPAEQASPARAPDAGSAPAAAYVEWTEGTRWSYALSLKSRVSLRDAASLLDLELSGRLIVRRFASRSGSTAALHVQVEDARLSSSRSDPDAALDAAASALEEGFAVELERGVPRRVLMRPSSPELARNLARTLAPYLQLLAAAPGATWEQNETDAAGVYRATYRAESPAGRYSKRKLGYEANELSGPSGQHLKLALTPQVVESEARLEVTEGALRSVVAKERLETALTDRQRAASETSLSLELLAATPAEPETTYADYQLGAEELGPNRPELVTRDDGALDAAKVGDFTFESAVAKLEQLLNDGLPLLLAGNQAESADARLLREQRVIEHNRAFSALVALLRLRPETVEAAVRRVLRHPKQAKIVLDALVAAETPAAQDALLGLAEAKGTDVELGRSVLASMGRIQNPTARTIETLVRWLDEDTLRVAAAYGLGSMARAIRARDAALSARAGRALVERLANERSSLHTVHLLRGIANSADGAAFDTVLPLLVHDNDSIRGAAVEALRLMQHPLVDGAIAKRLREERHPSALRAALNAAKPRAASDELSDAVAEVALSSRDSQARYRATRLLAGWFGQRPSLRSSLAEVARHDESEAVRRAADDALSGARP
jgi:hypothetical protein